MNQLTSINESKAFSELNSQEAGRAARVLDALSDHTEEPIDAAVIQGAFGAPLKTR